MLLEMDTANASIESPSASTNRVIESITLFPPNLLSYLFRPQRAPEKGGVRFAALWGGAAKKRPTDGAKPPMSLVH